MNTKTRTEKSSKTDTFDLWRMFNHTVYLIVRSRQQELAQYGLNIEQAYVLDILHSKNGTASIQDIVNTTLIQHHSISTLLSRMALQGLIKKNKSTADARQYNIVLTPKGAALFNKITRSSIADIFSVLTPRDQNGLRLKLKKLMLKAYKALGKKPHFEMFKN
jgi:DNA-binding MarR family transcriptional regulator